MSQTSKKLASVSATSVPVIDINGKEIVRVSCIHYLIRFQEDQEQKSQEQVRTLLNSGSKVNAMSPVYAKNLCLKTWKTNVGA